MAPGTREAERRGRYFLKWTTMWREIGDPRLRWGEPRGSKLGSLELGGFRLGWRELVGSRLRSAEHNSAPDDQTHATPGSRKLVKLGDSRLRRSEPGDSMLGRRE